MAMTSIYVAGTTNGKGSGSKAMESSGSHTINAGIYGCPSVFDLSPKTQ